MIVIIPSRKRAFMQWEKTGQKRAKTRINGTFWTGIAYFYTVSEGFFGYFRLEGRS